MKQSSYPPFIVFFDTLAIFLFLLILNQKNTPSETELISKEKIFAGGKLVYKENGSYYNEDGSPYHANPEGYYFLDCIEQEECKKLKSIKNNDIETYISLPDKLLKEMSYLTYRALNSKKCSSVKFFITEKGELDYKQMVNATPCILKFNGVRKKIENSS